MPPTSFSFSGMPYSIPPSPILGAEIDREVPRRGAELEKLRIANDVSGRTCRETAKATWNGRQADRT